LLVVVAELEVVFEPVEEVVAVVMVVVAWVDVDEEVLADVSWRIPPEEAEELVLVFEPVLVEALELLPELELPSPPSDLMLCQLPLSSV